MNDDTRGCTAARFASTHPYEYDPAVIADDNVDDWELCGVTADAPIHQVPAAEQTAPGWTTTPAGYLVPADLDDDPRLWTGEPMATEPTAAEQITRLATGLRQYSGDWSTIDRDPVTVALGMIAGLRDDLAAEQQEHRDTAERGQPTGGAAPAAAADDFYLRLSASLHLVAEKVATLVGQPDGSMFATLSFWPNAGSDGQNIDIVDAIGRALLGRPGELQKMSNGTYHHDASGHLGDLKVTAYRSVDPPEVRAQRDEVAALRARIAELESRP